MKSKTPCWSRALHSEKEPVYSLCGLQVEPAPETGHYNTLKSCRLGIVTTAAQTRLSALLVFFVDHADFAFFVEDRVEGFGFAEQDFAELFFLHDVDGLQLDHFEHRKEGHDHGVARRAGFKEFHQVGAGIFAGQDLAA